jgi:hypothetical protein
VSAATIWRTCPACGEVFEQPDDPGRKRVYCSRACQQAAYRTRQRTSAGQRQHAGQQRRDGAGQWRRDREGGYEQRWQRTGQQRPGAGQRQDEHAGQREQRQPPPTGANGHRPGATSDQRARFRRIVEALLRKAASTPYPHEAEACRAKAEALRAKYGL